MRERWTIGLGVLFLCLALLTLFFWIPRDVETGAVEIFRRAASIGDAMLPMALAIFMIIICIVLIISAFLSQNKKDTQVDRKEETGLAASNANSGILTRDNGKFLGFLLVTMVASFLVMYFLGPLVLALAKMLGLEAGSYREMRASIPWKYVGYGTGGPLLIFMLISFVEQSFRWRTALIAFAATFVIALLYDWPFDHLLLPPNGDY